MQGRERPAILWRLVGDTLLGADLFVAIRTSDLCYPAAGFMSEAHGHGVRTCEINLEPPDDARQAGWTSERDRLTLGGTSTLNKYSHPEELGNGSASSTSSKPPHPE
jgi:hypothetical protein